jgi:hypothetical protein
MFFFLETRYPVQRPTDLRGPIDQSHRPLAGTRESRMLFETCPIHTITMPSPNYLSNVIITKILVQMNLLIE